MTSFMMFYMCNSNFISNLTLYIRSLSLYVYNQQKEKKKVYLAKKNIGWQAFGYKKNTICLGGMEFALFGYKYWKRNIPY